MSVKTKKITKVGYLPKDEKISDTWHEIGLDSVNEIALSKQDAKDAISYSMENQTKKVRVVLMLTIEEL